MRGGLARDGEQTERCAALHARMRAPPSHPPAEKVARLASEEISAVAKLGNLHKGAFGAPTRHASCVRAATLPAHDDDAVARSRLSLAELDAEKAALATAHAETARLEASTKTIPVEVDAARAAGAVC